MTTQHQLICQLGETLANGMWRFSCIEEANEYSSAMSAYQGYLKQRAAQSDDEMGGSNEKL